MTSSPSPLKIILRRTPSSLLTSPCWHPESIFWSKLPRSCKSNKIDQPAKNNAARAGAPAGACAPETAENELFLKLPASLLQLLKYRLQRHIALSIRFTASPLDTSPTSKSCRLFMTTDETA
ncbi:hypothetical protein CSKR_107120 [Clonorchis sinensis]|uniref:Uncharacterized protein n=1 Tax=Clonorchis sinensis TaxID=79923 RepID=A0A419Q0B4_CLOSI|nr:hypothetical protein CSKR_107120 [Clonorchis sinensis]